MHVHILLVHGTVLHTFGFVARDAPRFLGALLLLGISHLSLSRGTLALRIRLASLGRGGW